MTWKASRKELRKEIDETKQDSAKTHKECMIPQQDKFDHVTNVLTIKLVALDGTVLLGNVYSKSVFVHFVNTLRKNQVLFRLIDSNLWPAT